MSAATLVTETGTCQGCGESIQRQPNAPHWLGTRDWHDPEQVDLDDNGTRCDGGITHHEPEPDVTCPQCKGAQELSDDLDVGNCPICKGTGEISADRAVELDNSGWCTNTGRSGLECGYLAACPECVGV